MQIQKPTPRAPVMTFFGEAGVGKNSLASAVASNPIVIRAEDGVLRQSKMLPVPDAFPVCRKAGDVFDQIRWLIKEDHEYDTLIVDTASSADALFIEEVLDQSGKQNLAQAFGGYGAGYGAVAAKHANLRKGADVLNQRKNMMIIFLVHADVEAVRPPDTDDYMRYTLRLTSANNADSVHHYVNNVDLVGHIRLSSFLRGEDDRRKRVISTGDRELVCHATAASVTKNGFGITEPLEFAEGTNPLAEYLGGAKSDE